MIKKPENLSSERMDNPQEEGTNWIRMADY